MVKKTPDTNNRIRRRDALMTAGALTLGILLFRLVISDSPNQKNVLVIKPLNQNTEELLTKVRTPEDLQRLPPESISLEKINPNEVGITEMNTSKNMPENPEVLNTLKSKLLEMKSQPLKLKEINDKEMRQLSKGRSE